METATKTNGAAEKVSKIKAQLNTLKQGVEITWIDARKLGKSPIHEEAVRSSMVRDLADYGRIINEITQLLGGESVTNGVHDE